MSDAVCLSRAFLFFFGALILPSVSRSEGTYPVDYYALGDQFAQYTVKSTDIHHTPLAVKYVRNGQYDIALLELQTIVGERIPNHPRGLMLLVEINRHRPITNVEEYFVRAVELNPQAATSHLIYGIYLQQAGRLEAAVERYKTAVTLAPDDRDAHYNLGLAYVDLKRYEDANTEAQVAYGLGHPLPGLRNKLQKIGAWRPSPVRAAETAPSVSPTTDIGAKAVTAE